MLSADDSQGADGCVGSTWFFARHGSEEIVGEPSVVRDVLRVNCIKKLSEASGEALNKLYFLKRCLGSQRIIMGQSVLRFGVGAFLALLLSSPAFCQKEHKHEEEHAEEFHGEWGDILPDDKSPEAQRYLKAAEELRVHLKAMRRIVVGHHTNIKVSRDAKLDEWLAQVDTSHAAHRDYRQAAVAIYRKDPVQYANFGHLLFYMLKTGVESDHFDGMAEIGKLLMDNNYPRPETAMLAGFACFAENDFDTAEKYMRANNASNANGPSQALASIGALKALWEREKSLREKEADLNLPRVKVVTTKGTIVIELFENEAPEAVANFIYLTENRFYNGRPIFRVEEHFVAQMGCERGDGTGNPGYTIRGEMKNQGARGHFRGSVGVALSSDPQTGEIDYDSGSAQFYFSFLPTPQMNGDYCVIGRIVEGMEVLGDFTRIRLGDKEWMKEHPGLIPDVMVRAEVLRKGDRQYKPTPIKGRLPFGS